MPLRRQRDPTPEIEALSTRSSTASASSTALHHSYQPQPKLQAFNGSDDKVTVENFIKLFEQLANLYKWDAPSKKLMFANYLEDTALNWYAESSHLNWEQLASNFLQRFGLPIVDPIIEFCKLKYSKKLGMKDYFEQKKRLGCLAKLNQSQIISMMIEGLPAKLSVYFITTRPQTYSHFFKIAKLAEEATCEAEAQPNRSDSKLDRINDNSLKQNKPSACKICQSLGFTRNFHWESDCWNKEKFPKNSPSDLNSKFKTANFLENPLQNIDVDALN